MENISKVIVMIFNGVDNLNFYSKRNYHREIPKITIPSPEERWQNVGNRLKNAMFKVVRRTE